MEQKYNQAQKQQVIKTLKSIGSNLITEKVIKKKEEELIKKARTKQMVTLLDKYNKLEKEKESIEKERDKVKQQIDNLLKDNEFVCLFTHYQKDAKLEVNSNLKQDLIKKIEQKLQEINLKVLCLNNEKEINELIKELNSVI